LLRLRRGGRDEGQNQRDCRERRTRVNHDLPIL
jgi:hypothetical protein